MNHAQLTETISRSIEEGIGPIAQEFVAAWEAADESQRNNMRGYLDSFLDQYRDEIGEADSGTQSFEDARQIFTMTTVLCVVTRDPELIEAAANAIRSVTADCAERDMDIEVPDPAQLAAHYIQ